MLSYYVPIIRSNNFHFGPRTSPTAMIYDRYDPIYERGDLAATLNCLN